MFQKLQQKWGVGPLQLFLILCVFAITGTTTAWLTRAIINIVGFDAETFWLWKLLLRLAVLIFGYQIILLCVAFVFGQFPFFWKYERKLLMRLGLIRKLQAVSYKPQDQNKPFMQTSTIEHRTSNQQHLAIFASGAGSNAKKIIEYFKDHPSIKVALIVCNKPGAGVLQIAADANIPALLIEKERFFRGDGYLPELETAGIHFIVLAGFLWKIPSALIAAYPRRIINIHPALLPKYGGRGMYGQYVHESVLQAGEVESGITIHYVDEHYDSGDIIFQTACPVLVSDTPETLAHRNHTLEHLHYPKVIAEVVSSLK
jgi:formyltetrahydrofolate-dependent phosphoribosylglycinamide formyltransferase